MDESRVQEVLAFLRTLWGKVAVATAALPGLSALFDVSIALENSPLKPMYPVLGTATSSFFILLLAARRRWFVRWKATACTAIGAAIVGLALLLAFLLARSTMDYQSNATYAADSLPGIVLGMGMGSPPTGRSDQNIEVRTRWDRGRGTTEVLVDGRPQAKQEQPAGIAEVLLLATFVSSMGFLAAAFTALGTHAYATSRSD